jgi:hypothetical protein
MKFQFCGSALAERMPCLGTLLFGVELLFSRAAATAVPGRVFELVSVVLLVFFNTSSCQLFPF